MNSGHVLAWLLCGPAMLSAVPSEARTAQRAAPVTAAWLAGDWVPAGTACGGDQRPLSLGADGYYGGPSDAGTWKLVKGKLVFTFRDLSQWGDELVSDQMEAASPVRSRVSTVSRLAMDAMLLDGKRWNRCLPV